MNEMWKNFMKKPVVEFHIRQTSQGTVLRIFNYT